MRLRGTKLSSISQSGGLGNQLWDLAGSRPSLDLQFADTKSLVDATTGQNLVTFSRASIGTYVDSQGVIRNATTNLLLRSEEFDNASWSKLNSVTISPNATTAPNGTVTADKIVENSDSSGKPCVQSVTLVSGATYTASVYFKAAERPTVLFHVRNSGYDIRFGGFFNTSTGVFTAETVGGATLLSSSFTSVGNGWYRCVITGQLGAVTAGVVTAYIANQTNLVDYPGDGTSGIYLWGAQLEQSSTVGEYIPTTSTINSAPRFDHNPSTGESLGLLVEEQRTNLLLYSACDSNWPTAGFGTATYNLGLSALGVFSGVQVASAGQTWHSIYRTGISLTASTVYAFTLFYRAGTSGRIRLVFRNNTTATETILNGLAGNLAVTAAFAGSATIISQYLCSDGLTYVVTGTFTPISTSADYWYRIGPDSATSGQTVIALGGQLEAGAFPTSYIPTTAATATRAADIAQITGTSFSSWYRQDEGTVFVEGGVLNNAVNRFFASITDGTINEEVGVFRQATFSNLVTDGGITQAISFGGTVLTNVSQKQVFGYRANDFQAYAEGAQLTTDTAGTLPTVNTARIGSRQDNSFYLNGHIRRLTYWPRRLPNATLQSITQ